MTTILVTGGTGTLGRPVVDKLVQAGQTVRVLTRHPREASKGVEYVVCDLLSGDIPIGDAEVLVHLAGGQKGDEVATRNLMAVAAKAGVKHVVYISVIGVDRVPLGWLKMKREAEQAVIESGIPWTILRAAQFHSLVTTVVEKMAKLPVVPVPGGLRMQPVDAGDVAVRLVELALGKPAGLVPDIAGPKVYAMRELIQAYLHETGKHRLLMPVRVPGKAGKAYRAGENLTLTGATKGAQTWEAFLGKHLEGARSR